MCVCDNVVDDKVVFENVCVCVTEERQRGGEAAGCRDEKQDPHTMMPRKNAVVGGKSNNVKLVIHLRGKRKGQGNLPKKVFDSTFHCTRK